MKTLVPKPTETITCPECNPTVKKWKNGYTLKSNKHLLKTGSHIKINCNTSNIEVPRKNSRPT